MSNVTYFVGEISVDACHGDTFLKLFFLVNLKFCTERD